MLEVGSRTLLCFGEKLCRYVEMFKKVCYTEHKSDVKR